MSTPTNCLKATLSGCSCPHVALEGLCVARDGRDLIRDLNLSVPRGSFVALTGPSGVGKSSLLACLAGMLSPTDGQITYRCEQDCEHSPKDFQQKLGLVFQHLHLTPNATALTNAMCGSLGQKPWWKTVFGFDRTTRHRAEHLLAELGLRDYLHVPVSRISGGEKQRVAIARAFMQSPELILADEPVSHLDAALSREVLAAMKAEAKKHQTTILCSLHDDELVREFSDFVLILNRQSPSAWRIERATPVAA